MNKENFHLHLRHLAGYKLAREEIKRKVGRDCTILEVGCGVGYGANFISSDFKVVGLDISKDALREARKYKHIHWILGDGTSLPFKDESFDAVISLQVIEHIKKREVFAYLNEIKRVLKRGGIFILTTPNRDLRLYPFQKPWNPFHEHEYSENELKRILKRVFPVSYVKGIGAVEELRKIEKDRVKQTVIDAYIKQPLGRILRRLSILPPLPVGSSARLLWKEFEEAKSKFGKYSLEDFFLEDIRKDSLDLFGVAFKE